MVIGLPAALAIGASWVDFSQATRADAKAPVWLTTETVRATTGNGDVVKARVAIDAADPATRALIERERAQVDLMLQISVAAHDRAAADGAEGMQRLAQDMRTRLNEFLKAGQVPPVREVVIQDLVFNKP